MSPSTDRAALSLLSKHPPSSPLADPFPSTSCPSQECGPQCGGEPEDRVTKVVLRRRHCRVQSFAMWRRHRPATGGRVEKFRHQLHDHKLCRKFHNLYRIKFSEPSCPDRKQSLLINLCRKLSEPPCSSRQQSPFHNLFRKKFVKQSLSCSKHRKHISNRGRRKSAVLDSRVSTRYIFNKTESAEDLPPSADTSQHSTQPRNLPERPGHPHCHCSSPAHVRVLLRVNHAAASARITHQQITRHVPSSKLIKSSTHLRAQCADVERAHQRASQLFGRLFLL